MGFTSADWVYGAQLTVTNNTAPPRPASITIPDVPRGRKGCHQLGRASTDADGLADRLPAWRGSWTAGGSP